MIMLQSYTIEGNVSENIETFIFMEIQQHLKNILI